MGGAGLARAVLAGAGLGCVEHQGVMLLVCWVLGTCSAHLIAPCCCGVYCMLISLSHHRHSCSGTVPAGKYLLTAPAGLPTCLPLGSAHAARRLPAAGAKEFVSWTDLADRVPALLEEIQADMFNAAKAKFDACLETVGLPLVPAAGACC